MKKRYILTALAFLLVICLALFSFNAIKLMEDEKREISKEIEYTIVTVDNYSKPSFNKKEINSFIDNYIEDNSCETLEFDITNISSDIVSLYLNCGNKKSIIYNHKKKEELNIKDLLQNESEFIIIVKELLNLKYPKYVTEEVNILDGIFDIKENEIIEYYKTKNYGEISIRINNNEIKDYINYTPKLDTEYENEKYTLDRAKKTIAFSFDDGPSTYDLKIIDALTESHASATFFMVGNRMNNYKSSINKMIETGMETGNHSYDHKYMGNMSKANVLNELNKTNNIFKSITGNELKIFRPPYGEVKKAYLKDTGLPSIIWSLDTLDWKYRDTEKVYNKIMGAKDGDIILMHSLYSTTRDAVIKSLPELYKKGFQVVSVSKLAELKGKSLEEATHYYSIK